MDVYGAAPQGSRPKHNILNPGRAEQAAPKVSRQQRLILPLYFFTVILGHTQAGHFERRGQEHPGVNRERDCMKR